MYLCIINLKQNKIMSNDKKVEILTAVAEKNFDTVGTNAIYCYVENFPSRWLDKPNSEDENYKRFQNWCDEIDIED